MNNLKQQILTTREYLLQNRMYSELGGFDAAVRLFADANKKSFKEKASEVWKKHKGKILAGAALAAAAGVGGKLGYDKYKEAKAAPIEEAAKKQDKEERIETIMSLLGGPLSNLNYIPLLGNVSSGVALGYYKARYPEDWAEAKSRMKWPRYAIPGMPGSKANYKDKEDN